MPVDQVRLAFLALAGLLFWWSGLHAAESFALWFSRVKAALSTQTKLNRLALGAHRARELQPPRTSSPNERTDRTASGRPVRHGGALRTLGEELWKIRRKLCNQRRVPGINTRHEDEA